MIDRRRYDMFNRYLMWFAILVLAILAIHKDAQLDKAVRKMQGEHELVRSELDSLDKRIKGICDYTTKR